MSCTLLTCNSANFSGSSAAWWPATPFTSNFVIHSRRWCAYTDVFRCCPSRYRHSIC